MDNKYKKKYSIPSTRLSNWDYGSHGLYYITICTKDRINYFGDIVGSAENETQNIASLEETQIGSLAYNNWIDIPNHFSFIELDDFVIMPNHIHGILFINKPNKELWEANKFGTQSQNLASVIRGYKASVKTFATKNNVDFNWQPRYYDHIIKTQKEYLNIREYIFNNPTKWLLNGDDEDNLYMS